MSARNLWMVWFLGACLAAPLVSRAQDEELTTPPSPTRSLTVPPADQVLPDVTLSPDGQPPMGGVNNGPVGVQMPWFNPFQRGRPWGIKLGFVNYCYLSDNFTRVPDTLLNSINPKLGNPLLEDQQYLGGSIGFEIPLTSILHVTTNLDMAGTMETETTTTPNGFNGVLSILFNVDPLVENIFYGAGVDLYMLPPLDPLMIPGGLQSTIVAQMRGGAGFTTDYGDWFFRGGGRMGHDEEPLTNAVTYFPAIDRYSVFSRSVGFTTAHYEGGLMTSFGPLATDIIFGYRTDPELAYFALNYRLPIGTNGWSIGGDYYIDRASNYQITLGLAFATGGVLDNTFRRILQPYSVGRANRMLNWGQFQNKLLKFAP